eukprot:8020122-Alexandrium_andersonii.AAC.1
MRRSFHPSLVGVIYHADTPTLFLDHRPPPPQNPPPPAPGAAASQATSGSTGAIITEHGLQHFEEAAVQRHDPDTIYTMSLSAWEDVVKPWPKHVAAAQHAPSVISGFDFSEAAESKTNPLENGVRLPAELRGFIAFKVVHAGLGRLRVPATDSAASLDPSAIAISAHSILRE